jgi:predicted secreted protein
VRGRTGRSTLARRVVTHNENGRTLRAQAGDEIVVVLPERATAGYQWQVAGPLPAGVEAFAPPPSPPTVSAIGADAPGTIGLRVTQSGTHRIRLLEFRPWEGPDKAVSTFELVVSVES